VIRPEYQALVDRLPALMRDFDSSISEAALRELGVLMAATECIDRQLDRIADQARRRAFVDAVIAALHEPSQLEPELDRQLGRLRVLLVRHGIAASFVSIARELFRDTERARTTLDVGVYLDSIEREGRAMVELALLFIDPHGDPRFVAFLRAVGDAANVVDKLLDARADFARGELAVRPSLWLHARIAGRLVRRVPRIARLHPSRVRFVMWGASWLRVMLQPSPATASRPSASAPASRSRGS
jgi:hypothetical protein